MKKVLCALCAAALLLTACGGGESQEGSPQDQMLQNRQKQVIMYITQTNYDENGEVSGWFRTEHRYDTKGNLLGMDNYDGYGSWWENTYNADGVLVSCSYYNADGQKTQTKYYDMNGNLTRNELSSFRYYADGTQEPFTEVTVYTYDEQGRLQERISTEDGQEKVHENYTYEDATHTGTMRQMMLLYDKEEYTTQTLTYNEDWQVLTRHRDQEDGGLMDVVYTYDDAGNLLSEVSSGGSDYTVVYTYDADGNMVQGTCTWNGKLDYVLESTLGTLKEALERQEMLQAQEEQEEQEEQEAAS